jgi:hypothetical protein
MKRSEVKIVGMKSAGNRETISEWQPGGGGKRSHPITGDSTDHTDSFGALQAAAADRYSIHSIAHGGQAEKKPREKSVLRCCGAGDFHWYCDGCINTFTLIEDTEGNTFRASRRWSGSRARVIRPSRAIIAHLVSFLSETVEGLRPDITAKSTSANGNAVQPFELNRPRPLQSLRLLAEDARFEAKRSNEGDASQSETSE